MADTTVDLPADEDIKQLAHDVVREENEYAVPLLRDFYKFLRQFDEEDHKEDTDLFIDDPESELPPGAWQPLIESLSDRGVVEKHLGRDTTYTLASDED